MRSWEASLLDWSPKGIDGAEVTPDQVMELLQAGSDGDANRAYWRLDGVVCLSGRVYAAALPVTQMILSMLPSCSLPARRRSLELLGQIAAGESDPETPDVVDRCLSELRQSSWYLIHGLQFDEVDMAWLYVDLIGILGEVHADFRERARRYLERVLGRELPEGDVVLVEDTISGLL